MKNSLLTTLFSRKEEKTPMKWLFPAEIAMIAYAVFTLAVIFFTFTHLKGAESLVWWRLRLVFCTLALWLVYRLWTCRFTAFARIALLLLTLSWWYPDTYLLNSQFPNLDYIFAAWDQKLFGFQPALIWHEVHPSVIVSELMAFGYASYFFFFVSLIFLTFFKHYNKLQKVTFIIIGSFCIYYVIYVLLPVAGPQYYYKAVGLDEIAHGNFPELGNYFADHMEALPVPGAPHGIFRSLVELMHQGGERPTAAFPSSHVGISTIALLCFMWLKEWRWVMFWAVPWLLLVMSTVYLQPHYAVDVIGGLVSAVLFFFLLMRVPIKN